MKFSPVGTAHVSCQGPLSAVYMKNKDEIMDRWSSLKIGAVVAATFGILYLNSLPRENVGNTSSRSLVIGVLSARDHFLQRDAVRRTWGSHVSKLPNSELLFMVGEYDCPIHPEDRISPYTCNKWDVLYEDVEDTNSKIFFKRNLLQPKADSSHLECYIGIGFQILHPILLEKVSVSKHLLSRIGNCTAILQDAEEVLERVEVTLQFCSKEPRQNAYCDIKLPHQMLLPKHFEGELRLVKATNSEEDFCGQGFFSLHQTNDWVCDWPNSSAIKIKYLRSINDALTKWIANQCPLLSAVYSIADRDDLKKHIESESSRKSEWEDHLEFVLRKIAIEQVVHRDMVVVPHLDVYSKLPQKMLAFFKRLTLEFEFTFMMKVDDDTFVNISSLKTLMNLGNDNLPKIWSRFHHHRSVPLYGKWADSEYPSLTYPSFPAGAGYLMSGSVVQSLSQAGSHLTSYVGEDVSIGIWISSVVNHAILIDVPCWLPRSECQETVLIPQLSPIDMMEIWKKYA